MIYGLIGEKLSHSYSPQIHKIFFGITGIQGEYRLFELRKDELGSFLTNAFQKGCYGLNVTIPYKTDIIPFLKNVSQEAQKIGAVNTITLNGNLKGYNTDYFGIDYTLKKNHLTMQGKRALITGSGGAAKAAMAFLLDSGVSSVYLASRSPLNINDKSESVIPITYEKIVQYRPFDMIMNTTPVGMYPKTGVSPLTSDQIKGTGFIFDLIYNPIQTELMKLADALKIPSVNGLYMLIAQAVKAQEIWNGKDYGLDVIDAIHHQMNRQFD